MTSSPVVIYTAAGRVEAEMIKGLLEAAGIPVVLSQEGAGAVYGLTVGPLGAVEVLVSEAHAIEAQALIAALEHGDLEAGAQADPAPPAEDDPPPA